MQQTGCAFVGWQGRRADLLKVWLGMKLEKADRNDGKGGQGKVQLESSVYAVLGYQVSRQGAEDAPTC